MDEGERRRQERVGRRKKKGRRDGLFNKYKVFKGIKIYYTVMQRDYTVLLEYQSVCSFVRIGSPRPFFRKRVCPPPEPWGGGATLACG
jgi:hypothetical protein